MSRQQLGLMSGKAKREAVDQGKIDGLVRGDTDLREALSLSDEVITGLRRQAVALAETGKWQACIDVILGLSALGNVHPADPPLLARCYDALGQPENAHACLEHAIRLSEATGVVAPDLVETWSRS